jgi:hypothetical protein
MPEQLNETETITRALAVLAAVAEDRYDDVEPLLDGLARSSVAGVVRSLAGLTVDSVALLRGLDYETPEGRAEVADQARRLVMRELADNGDG